MRFCLEKQRSFTAAAAQSAERPRSRSLARGPEFFWPAEPGVRLEEVADLVRSAGGEVEIAVLDALDPAAVEAHAESVVARTQRIDVALNALGLKHVQRKSFADQTLDEFATPIVGYTRAHFIIAKATSPAMVRQGSGVILALSTPGSVLPGPGLSEASAQQQLLS
ncbi:MAG TPA: SDR family oxidoreductase [Polyangiaceae bacterium]|nr:SDR family oxidoreductase [Polyangiaceae bacterium]